MSRAHHLSEEVEDAKRALVLATMVAYYDVMGCSSMRARLRGYKIPGVLEGKISDFRPDLTCQSTDKKRTWILCAVVMAEDVLPTAMMDLQNRLHLFSWACQNIQGGAEMHIAVEGVKLKGGLTLAQTVKEKCAKWGLKFKQVHIL